MDKKRIFSKKNTSEVLQVMIGVLLALLITLIGMVVGASFLENGIITEMREGWYTFAIWFMAPCIATMLLTFSGERNFITICAIGVIYFIILLCIKMLFIDCAFCGIGKGIIAIIAGVIPALLIIFYKSNGKRKKYKYSGL